MATPQISSPDEYLPIVDITGYNQVLKVGNRIDISGQGGWDYEFKSGVKFSYKSLEEEIENAFRNVENVLKSVGASSKDIYSVTSYHVNLKETSKEVIKVMQRLYKQYIGDRAPLWTCLGVEALGEKQMNVEIVVTAFTK